MSVYIRLFPSMIYEHMQSDNYQTEKRRTRREKRSSFLSFSPLFILTVEHEKERYICIYKVIFLFSFVITNKSHKKERKEMKKKTGFDYKGLLIGVLLFRKNECVYVRERTSFVIIHEKKMDTWRKSSFLVILTTSSTRWWSIVWFVSIIKKSIESVE